MFKGELFPAQKPAANFLCKKERALLAWEQGTGKTVISIAAADKLLELGLINSALIVAPSSIAWQWQDKIHEFTDWGCNYVRRTRRPQAQGRSYSFDEGTPFVVTGYSLFRRDFDRIAENRYGLVITDECQEYKNHKSRTYELLRELNKIKRSRYFWGETGTAISTKLEELYSILYVIKKDFLPPWPVFEELHVVRNPSTNAIMRYENLADLAGYLPRRVNRKTHRDLDGQMPEIVPQQYTITKGSDLANAEKTLLSQLDRIAEDLTFDSEGELEASARDPEVSKAFQAVQRLLISTEKVDHAAGLASRILEENATNRVAVFSRLKEPLRDLRDKLADRGVAAHMFTGDQDADEKREAVRAFRARPGVLCASNAGKKGLDIPELNYIIFLDVPFSWEVLDQRCKRGTRANSIHKTCVVIFLMIEDSLEQYYLEITKAIGRLSDAVHGSGDDTVVIKTQSARQYLHGITSKESSTVQTSEETSEGSK